MPKEKSRGACKVRGYDYERILTGLGIIMTDLRE